MTESIQHNEKEPVTATRPAFHRTLIRWKRPLWEEVTAAAQALDLDFGAYVRLAVRNELRRTREKAVA